jgi:KaiC/GvpD/RAD55 family RecA-like ATPase
VVEGLVPEDSLGILAGPPGGAKTFAALRLLADASTAGHVGLLVEEECSAWDLKRRFRAAGGDFSRLRVLHQRGVRLDAPEWFERLERASFGCALVVLDPLANLHGLDDREQDDMATLFGLLSKLQRAARTALTVVHHTGKVAWGPDVPRLADIRGSSVIAGRLDWAYVLKPLVTRRANEEEEEEAAAERATRFEVHCVKMRSFQAPRPRVGVLETSLDADGAPAGAMLRWEAGSVRQARTAARTATVEAKVLAFCAKHEATSTKGVWEAMGGRKVDVMHSVRDLLARGLLTHDAFNVIRPVSVSGSPAVSEGSPGDHGEVVRGGSPIPLGKGDPRTPPSGQGVLCMESPALVGSSFLSQEPDAEEPGPFEDLEQA